MEIKIVKTSLAAIQAFRALFLQENNFQFIYNKCHQFGWADTWLFMKDGIQVGYGSVWGKDNRHDRDTIFEFYLLPPYRKYSNFIFPEFYMVSEVRFVECQSNDGLLTSMLYEYCRDINAEAILFKDHFTTHFSLPDVIFRKQIATDNLGEDGGYVLEQAGETIASGGFVWNYNLPFIDMFYEVKENFRRKGWGSLMTQELKKEAYLLARVPAARCNIHNFASKATLLKAGMQVCGCILTGNISKTL